MLQVYKKGNTNFSGNGDLTPEVIGAESVINLNGVWEMTATFPLTKEIADAVTEDAVVKVKMPEFREPQFWYIYKKEGTDTEIRAYLYPIFWQSADDCILMDVRPTGKDGQEALNIMCASNKKYSGESNIRTGATAYYYHKNLMEAIQGDDENAFLKRWGGEVLYSNYKIIINERIGGDYGARAEMGYNISGIQETVDMTSVKTRIYPVGFNGRTLSGTPYVDSQKAGRYPFIRAAFMKFEDVKYVDDVENEEEKAEAFQTVAEFDEELRRRVREQYGARIDEPAITYKIDFVELSETVEYGDLRDLVKVGFGDTVRVRHRQLGIDTCVRCIGRTYDHVRDCITAITLGRPERNTLDDVGNLFAAASEVIDTGNRTVMADKVAGILNAMQTQLRYQKNIAQDADVRAVLFEDMVEKSPTFGAMCMGTQGLQIAKRRTEDGRDWEWTTAITAAGISALAIVTGIIADKTGQKYWNLDTGEFMLSESDCGAVRIGANGIQVANKKGSGGWQWTTAIGADGISALAVVTGIIRDKTGQNFWNLETGEFKISQKNAVDGITNGGEAKGIYVKDGQIWISFDYAKGGTLTLGGENNVDGQLRVLNASGEQVASIDKDGVVAEKGMIAGWNIRGNSLVSQDFELNGETGAIRTYKKSDHSKYISMYENQMKTFINTKHVCAFFGEGPYDGHGNGGEGTIYVTDPRGRGMVMLQGNGDFYATGKKSRLMQTKNYGFRKLYCNEAPTPVFEDFGSAVLAEDGRCYVFMDDIFRETIADGMEYHVFLQGYGGKSVSVAERKESFFVAAGEPGVRFAWRVVAKQGDAENIRMEKLEYQDYRERDYASAAEEYILDLQEGYRE